MMGSLISSSTFATCVNFIYFVYVSYIGMCSEFIKVHGITTIEKAIQKKSGSFADIYEGATKIESAYFCVKHVV